MRSRQAREGRTGRAGRAARIAAWATHTIVVGLLAACSVAPKPVEAPSSDSTPAALRPLARQPALPPGAAPHSQVPSVRYDLAVSGTGESMDDGVPGDEGPREIFERGGASWYGIQFHQRKTANGERFDMTAMTAAHKTLPFNTLVCVRSLVNGREVLVRINDRGPYAGGRIIDLSRAAANALDMLSTGIKRVALSIMSDDAKRCAGKEVDLKDELLEAKREAEREPEKVVVKKTPSRSVSTRASRKGN
ncbi:MAG: septal ring lytic transglycosylase RlpA family protein [Gammaproteobacteria bacterium]|nr:septal ring lytic transglycosylase RlpA family protein [Gammaproteobacteria bacterium]MBU1442982.1 septal ring lytic transglycosylase RlpA family protein [Gammaproteobacteria bacterium]MBU2289118.1 septal ring lytic transglycosylase RlpA family protein [Gammaproteobacteria bacterium]MBU2408535.1 septal ring lytic transglycosylase RlpA family protein [Gammaproteobacteria bacterium]